LKSGPAETTAEPLYSLTESRC